MQVNEARVSFKQIPFFSAWNVFAYSWAWRTIIIFACFLAIIYSFHVKYFDLEFYELSQIAVLPHNKPDVDWVSFISELIVK